MSSRGLSDAHPEGTTDTVTLAVSGVSKHFAGTPALTDADLSVRQGTIHALLGGNGSGKSTLIKCLTGVHKADSGTARILGHDYAAADLTSRRAHEAGLRVVHQDLGVFERMTIAENFAFESGFPRNPAGGIAWTTLRRRVATLLEQYEIPAAPDTPVLALRPAAKTLVAIARALQDQEGSEYVLLLDEPTASLPDHESRVLMASLRRRAQLGQTIVLVSHRMQEVLETADDFTVFRDGRVAGTIADRRPSETELVKLIAGRAINSGSVTSNSDASQPVLQVTGLQAGQLRGVDLTVHRGEVVGIAGLLGSGRSTVLSCIFGLRHPESGTIALGGKPLADGSVNEVMARGVALVPQDRLGDASFPSMTVTQNASASVLGQYWRAFMRTARERRDTGDLVKRFAVKTTSLTAPFLSLSGGNQQKVVLARWMRRDPLLLLLDEPTQGVDVVSRTEIYAAIRDFTATGGSVLIASSDFAELAEMCDRVLILANGRVVAESSGPDMTIDRLTHLVQTADALQGISS